MRKFGIIARKSERAQTRPWWKFWQREDDYEEIEFEELNCAAVVVYVPDGDYSQYEAQVAEFLRSRGAYEYVKTTDENGAELERALLPRKLQYLTRKYGLDTRNCSVVYEGEEVDGIVLLELARICKSICVVTKKTAEAERISNRIFAELGLLLDVKSEMPLHIGEYDYLLKTNGEIGILSEGKTRMFSIYSEKQPVLPVKVNSLPLLKTLWKTGVIGLDDISFS